MDGPVEQLCAMVDDWQVTGELGDLPAPVWNFIKRKSFSASTPRRNMAASDFPPTPNPASCRNCPPAAQPLQSQ